MDIRIYNKDIAVRENGQPERIEGISEYLQRAYVSLCAERGCFCYKRDLGAFKKLSEIINPLELQKEAEAAVSDMPELTIISAEKKDDKVIFIIETPFGEGIVEL